MKTLTLTLSLITLVGCMTSGTFEVATPIEIITDGLTVTSTQPATLEMTWGAPDVNLFYASSRDEVTINVEHLLLKAVPVSGVTGAPNDSAFGYDGEIMISDVWKDDGWQEEVWLAAEVEAWKLRTSGGDFLDLYMGFNSESGRFLPFINCAGEEGDMDINCLVIDEDRLPMSGSPTINLVSFFGRKLDF